MKIVLPQTGRVIEFYVEIGDINFNSGKPITSNYECDKLSGMATYQKILENLDHNNWFADMPEIYNFLDEYREYKFYESSVRNIIISSLGLVKNNSGDAVGLSCKEVSGLVEVFKAGHEWILANKEAILADLNHKMTQEAAALKAEFASLVDQEISDQESLHQPAEIAHDAAEVAQAEVAQAEVAQDHKDTPKYSGGAG